MHWKSLAVRFDNRDRSAELPFLQVAPGFVMIDELEDGVTRDRC